MEPPAEKKDKIIKMVLITISIIAVAIPTNGNN